MHTIKSVTTTKPLRPQLCNRVLKYHGTLAWP